MGNFIKTENCDNIWIEEDINSDNYKEIIVQEWESSDSWSGVEPEGWSLHYQEKDLNSYIRHVFQENKKGEHNGQTPSFYIRVSGNSIKVKVPNKIHSFILKEGTFVSQSRELSKAFILIEKILNK